MLKTIIANFLFLCVIIPFYSQWTEEQKIFASIPNSSFIIESGDEMGRSLSIDGNYAVVGVPNSNISGSFSGAAFIYRLDGSSWVQQAILLPSNPNGGDRFGFAVSISGSTVIVGAYADGSPPSGGSAYIFEKDFGGTDNWGEVKKLVASDAIVNNNRFGFSVDISGSLAIVGDDKNTANGVSSGAAYIFEKDFGGTDNWGEVKKLLAVDGQVHDNFGRSVGIDGSFAVVGAHVEDENGMDTGSAYIFEEDNGGVNNWGQLKKVFASDTPEPNDFFGHSVSINNNLIAVGTFRSNDIGASTGSVYIFEKDFGGSNNWGEVKKVVANDGGVNDFFGFSVSLTSTNLVVGAFQNSSSGSNSGAAYIFEKDFGGTDNWGQIKKLKSSDCAFGDNFGVWVSISNDHVISGAFHNNDFGLNSGSAYIFERNNGGTNNWGQTEKLLVSGIPNDSDLGPVSISGNFAIVGASGTGSNTGSAFILYKDTSTTSDWEVQKQLFGSDVSGSKRFGNSVSISGDFAIVGAFNLDGSMDTTGVAYIFEKDFGGADNWGEVKKIIPSIASSNAQFGQSVSISSTLAIVGANNDSSTGFEKSGSAFVFEKDFGGTDNWGEVKKLVASDATSIADFGYALSLSGSTAVIGSRTDNSVEFERGAAYIFEKRLWRN